MCNNVSKYRQGRLKRLCNHSSNYKDAGTRWENKKTLTAFDIRSAHRRVLETTKKEGEWSKIVEGNINKGIILYVSEKLELLTQMENFPDDYLKYVLTQLINYEVLCRCKSLK